MNSREQIFFVGNCLGLRLHPEREDKIRKTLQSGTIHWERFAWISSNYFVIPALYVQLKTFDLLKELPLELSEHFEYIYTLNYERNVDIKYQVLVVVKVLNNIGISPIFLKGTAHLFDNLYVDIAERMVGDIDFLVAEKDILPAAEALLNIGYYQKLPYLSEVLKKSKHYPRLLNDNVLAALEIHRQPVTSQNEAHFNYDIIFKEKKQLKIDGEAYVLSDHHQIIHNMMNTQLNDAALRTKDIFLRNSYDLFLLALRCDTLAVAQKFGHYKNAFHSYLKVTSEFLGKPPEIRFENIRYDRLFFWWTLYFLDHPKFQRLFMSARFFATHISRYFIRPIRAIYNKAERQDILWKLRDRESYKFHYNMYKDILFKKK